MDSSGPETGNASIDRHGDAAIAGLDRAIAERPRADASILATVTRDLCLVRDELVRRRREGDRSAAAEERLARLNTVLSLVLSAHFPLGEIRWTELEQGRSWLADIVHPV